MLHRRSPLFTRVLFPALLLVGCGEAAPTAATRVQPPTAGLSFEVSEVDAFSTADRYDDRQPLAPFGVTEWEFNENPELVTDEQFIQQGENSLPDWEVPYIESDAYEIGYHTDTCGGYHYYGGGGGGGGSGGGGGDYSLIQSFSYDRCDKLYESCTIRCRRIPNPKGRAACWVACMAAYALCRANK